MIAVLHRSKDDVVLFFKGSGVSARFLSGLDARVRNDGSNIRKVEIARLVLVSLNEQGDATLRERREVLALRVDHDRPSLGVPDRARTAVLCRS